MAWVRVVQESPTPGALVRRLRGAADRLFPAPALRTAVLSDAALPAFRRLADLVGGRSVLLRIPLAAGDATGDLEPRLVAQEGPSPRARASWGSHHVLLEPREMHPLWWKDRLPAVVIEACHGGRPRLEEEFEAAALDWLARLASVPPDVARRIVREPRTRHIDAATGREVRQGLLDDVERGVVRVLVFDRRGLAPLWRDWIAGVRARGAPDFLVRCSVAGTEVETVARPHRDRGIRFSLDLAPDGWETAVAICDRLRFHEIDSLWFETQAGAVPGVAPRTSVQLRATYRRHAGDRLAVWTDAPRPARTAIGEALSCWLGEPLPEIPCRLPDPNPTAFEARRIGGEIAAALERILVERLGYSAEAVEWARDTLELLRIEAYKGLVLAGSLGDLEDNLDRFIPAALEMKPQIEEGARAHREIRERLAARLGIPVPEVDVALRTPRAAAVVRMVRRMADVETAVLRLESLLRPPAAQS